MKSIIILSAAITLSGCGEIKNERYADFEAARLTGAVEQGWIPDFVPQSANDIRDIHDLDSNAQTLSFRAPVSQIPAMVQGMTVARDEATAARIVKSAGWTAEVRVYAVCGSERSGALAVNERTGEAVFRAPVTWSSYPCPGY